PGARVLLADTIAPSFDPFTLPDMTIAVDRVVGAMRKGEPITVFGDFDADGITGTAVLVQGLRRLGANALPYIPHRDEGYGMNVPALEAIYAGGTRVVLTVDMGTSAVDEIAAANEMGMHVVVLDHHAIPLELPAADAIVNPYRIES